MLKKGQQVWQIGCFLKYYRLPLSSLGFNRLCYLRNWQVIPKKKIIEKVGKKGYCLDSFLGIWSKGDCLFVKKADADKACKVLNKIEIKTHIDDWIRKIKKGIAESRDYRF